MRPISWRVTGWSSTRVSVEGISNLLWTLEVALGMALGCDARAGVLREQSAWAGVAPWLVLASPAFARWSTSGMETPMFVAATTGTLAAEAWGRRGLATVLVCVATGVRPEGALLAASLFGFRLLAPGLRDPRAGSGLAVYTLLWIGSRHSGSPATACRFRTRSTRRQAVSGSGWARSSRWCSRSETGGARCLPRRRSRATAAPGPAPHSREGSRPDSLVPAGAAIRAHPELARHCEWDADIVGFRRVR